MLHNRTGWRFRFDDAQGLAEAIQRALLASPDERARITVAARRTFQHTVTADVMVEHHEAPLLRRNGLQLVRS